MALETKTGIVVLNPTVEAAPVAGSQAPRPATLHGKVIGLLANGKHNAPELLDLVQEMLADRYRLAGIVRLNKGDASRPAAQRFIDELAGKCDVVLTATGD